MKYLLVLAVIVVFGWVMLRGRTRRADAPKTGGGVHAQAMVACDHCGVHLPRQEVLRDATGSFCSEAHRLAGPKQG